MTYFILCHENECVAQAHKFLEGNFCRKTPQLSERSLLSGLGQTPTLPPPLTPGGSPSLSL